MGVVKSVKRASPWTNVWLQTDGSAVQVMTAALDPATGGWSPAQALSPASDSVASAPALATEPRGNALAMWLEQQGDGPEAKSEVRWARYVSGLGWRPEASVLSTPAVDAREVTLAMDGRGRASAAWTEADALWVARYE
jgi:hypothetical protein